MPEITYPLLSVIVINLFLVVTGQATFFTYDTLDNIVDINRENNRITGTNEELEENLPGAGESGLEQSGSSTSDFGFITLIWDVLKLLGNVVFAPITLALNAQVPNVIVVFYSVPALIINTIGIVSLIRSGA